MKRLLALSLLLPSLVLAKTEVLDFTQSANAQAIEGKTIARISVKGLRTDKQSSFQLFTYKSKHILTPLCHLPCAIVIEKDEKLSVSNSMNFPVKELLLKNSGGVVNIELALKKDRFEIIDKAYNGTQAVISVLGIIFIIGLIGML